MEGWRIRLVEEYNQLHERLEKLNTLISKEEFYKKVGNTQYFYIVSQYTGMRIYKEFLEARLEDLGIKVK